MTASRLHHHAFANGLLLVAESIPNSCAASFQFLIPAGAATDPEDRSGSASMIYDMAFRGAGDRDSRDLSDALDALGLQRDGGADVETTTYGGSLLSADLDAALEIYADILLRPRLPADQTPLSRAAAIHRIEAVEDHPAQKLSLHLRETFLDGPHGRAAMGTKGGIERIDADSLRVDHDCRYRPEGAVLGVAGRFDWDGLIEHVGRLFGGWTGSPPPLPSPNPSGVSRYRHVPHPAAQEQIGVAYVEAAPDDPAFYDVVVAVQVLSGGFASRLFTEVREKRGLAYSVSAGLWATRGFGMVTAHAGTTPERSQETLDVLIAELRRIAEGVAEDEVARARTGLLSALVMQGESSGARVGAIVRDQYLRGRVRDLDEIREEVEKVTPDSIGDRMSAHPPDRFTVVTLGERTLEAPL